MGVTFMNRTYEIGRKLCLSEKYKSIEKEYNETVKIQGHPNFQKGFKNDVSLAYEDTFPQYKNYNGLSNTPEWSDFCNGWYSVERDRKEVRRKELKIDEFLVELEKLCKQYQVSLDSGCGCCGAGGYCQDYDFEIKIK